MVKKFHNLVNFRDLVGGLYFKNNSGLAPLSGGVKTPLSTPDFHDSFNERHAHLPKESFLGDQRIQFFTSLSSEGAEVSHLSIKAF